MIETSGTKNYSVQGEGGGGAERLQTDEGAGKIPYEMEAGGASIKRSRGGDGLNKNGAWNRSRQKGRGEVTSMEMSTAKKRVGTEGGRGPVQSNEARVASGSEHKGYGGVRQVQEVGGAVPRHAEASPCGTGGDGGSAKVVRTRRGKGGLRREPMGAGQTGGVPLPPSWGPTRPSLPGVRASWTWGSEQVPQDQRVAFRYVL